MRDRGVVPVDGQVVVSLQFEIDSDDHRHASIADAPVGASTLSQADTDVFTECYKAVNIGQSISLEHPLVANGFVDHELIVFPIEGDSVYQIFRDNGRWPYPRRMPAQGN
jgi:hypothetical protein